MSPSPTGRSRAKQATLLLDVNVLIALFDPLHVANPMVRAWYASGRSMVASCPLTELGFVRICTHPRYPNPLDAPADALALLRALHREPRHVFWPDAISLATQAFERLPFETHRETTDRYLLRLAVHRKGTLLTLDSALRPADAAERAALRLLKA